MPYQRSAALYILLLGPGGSVSGSISSSYSWKDASATRRATRKRTPLMTDSEQHDRRDDADDVGHPPWQEAVSSYCHEVSVSWKSRASAIKIAKTAGAIRATSSGRAVSTGSSFINSRIEFCHRADRQKKMIATIAQPVAAASLATCRRRPEAAGLPYRPRANGQPMPYPAARGHPVSPPCVKKLRGSSVGVRGVAKNNLPRRRPLVENECHSPLPVMATPLDSKRTSASSGTCRASWLALLPS
jgi:hypothetical protein